MRIPLGIMAFAVVVISATEDSRAASIGVNFYDGTLANQLTANVTAGVVPQDHWMNVSNTTATSKILFDNLGNATNATLSYSGSLTPSVTVNPNGGDEILNNSYLASFSPTMTFTISNISYESYDLYVNVVPISTGRVYSITANSTTYYGSSPDPIGDGFIDGDNDPAFFTYTQALGTTNATATANATYFRFSGLTNSTLTFSVTGVTDGIPVVNAFQIVAVPEPGSAFLLAGGVCVIALASLRKRSAKHS